MLTRIAVLVSGGGTNLQALIDAKSAGALPSGEIVLVISSRADAYALERAKSAGIESAVCKTEDAILALITEKKIDLIILAGYMSILSADFTARFPQRIINIHPSLIPAFCGKGYYGLHVHEAVLQSGVKLTGATVHFVTADCDAGPIIAQKAVPVLEGDTPEILQRRVMEQCEWQLLPQAVALFCQDKIQIMGNKTRILD